MYVNRTQAWTDLESFLRSRDGVVFLDDAVLGALTEAAAMDLLADFDLDWSPENRRYLAVAIDAAIREDY